ncbi:uncharacterized protein LOC119461279 isoform X2 [Dermacentor silvarum]|uniref:uncharacterized protein LOC119461279 isoform X2 n=1 Tax=Dermacentor silvarum TaxID=543639 RepID=UPI002100DBF2|nr:uncharacterized protein LOC119461279 isoform X2 [Dermacentor silvarum]
MGGLQMFGSARAWRPSRKRTSNISPYSGCPGMLGHYSEARAYVNRDEEAQQHADVFLDFDDDPVSKEAIQHDWSGMLFSQEENPFVDEDNDFILIAECNEVHGPMPLVTIPHNIGDRVESIDINSLVISILSVDYQQVGASSTFPKLDSQILMPSIRDDLHILVNYSVMLDPKARGFVRPMCIAYASSDKGKLVKNARYIRSALIEASLALKLFNIKYFVQGIRNLLKDVKYTRRLNVGCGQRLETLNGASISEASFHESLNKYEDMLESALQEIEDSLAAGCPFDADHARRIKYQAKDLVRHLLNLPRLSPELERFLQFATEKESPHEPRELKIPFQRDYEHGLVPLRDIWKKGFILCIYWLYVTYKFFRRRAESVAVCLQQEKPLSSLRYGACLRSTDSTRASASSLVSNGNMSSHDKCSRSSHPMCIYYRLAHPECLPFDKTANGVWDVDSGFLDCFSHLHLDKGAVEREKENGSVNHSMASMPLPEELYSRFEAESRRMSESEKGSSLMETYCKTKAAATSWRFWHIRQTSPKDAAGQRPPILRTTWKEQLLRQRRNSGSSNYSEEHGERSYWIRDEEGTDPADCSRHGLTLEKQWDALQTCVHDGSEAIFLQVLNRRVKVEDILYSLLMGRPIVVVGRPLSAHEVAASAKVLALFAPRRFGDFLWFEDQRFDSLDNSCLNATAVIGYVDEHRAKDFGLPSSVRKKASVLNVETSDFTGPCYGGALLKQTSQRIRLLEENEALLAVISSVLADIEYVAHTWVLLTASARKTESKAFAKQKQLTNCDMAILKHYEKLMSDVHTKK